jgi:hypothetical protein
MKHPPIPYSLQDPILVYSLSGAIGNNEVSGKAQEAVSSNKGFTNLPPSTARRAAHNPQLTALGVFA